MHKFKRKFLSLEHKIHMFSPPCNIIYLFHRENGFSGTFDTSANTRSIRIIFFLVLALVLSVRLMPRVKTKHGIGNTKFTTSGRVWPIKALVPDSSLLSICLSTFVFTQHKLLMLSPVLVSPASQSIRYLCY